MLNNRLSIEVISTGNELLYGRIVDTNSSWIAKRITELGGHVKRITCVGDTIEEISEILNEALERNNEFIIFTGGLGPTKDDITVEGLGFATGYNVIIDPKGAEKIRRIYAERGIKDVSRGKKMARILESSKPIPNLIGLAIGMILKIDSSTIITLPGVPDEMKAMFNEHISPLIEDRSGTNFVAKTVNVKIVWKDFFPIYRKMQEDYPEVYIKNVATPPQAPKERLKVKKIIVNLVVERATKKESKKTMEKVINEFRRRVEALNGELTEI